MPFSALSDGDSIHFLLLAILDISAIVCNLILISAIFLSTPVILQNYAVILLFMAIVDCNAAFMSLLSAPMLEAIVVDQKQLFTFRTENMEGAVIFIYIGPCRHIHEKVCNFAQAIHVESVGESCVLLLVSFSYRLFSFSSTISTGPRTDSRFRLFCICLLATIPAVIATIAWANASPSTTMHSLKGHPEIAGRFFTVFNLTAANQLSTENWLPRACILHIFTTYSMASPILFILRRKLLQKIRSLVVSSDKSRHQMIFRSLTIQMFLPLFFSVAFVFWLLDFLEIYRLKAFQRAILPISSAFTLIAPLVIIYYLPPYRKFVLTLASSLMKTNVVTVIPSSGQNSMERKRSQTI